jgi:acyl-CoA synthetase (AMP-forming)/AMP-acid ligase II
VGIDSRLLGWLDDPRTEVGFRFADDEGGWPFTSYADLADATRRVAGQLVDLGCPHGGIVAIVLLTGPEFGAAMFGAQAAGCTPCSLAPPGFLQDEHDYVEHVAQILRQSSPHAIVTDPALVPVITRACEAAGLAIRPTTLDPSSRPIEPHEERRTDLALLQFTSGSSGTPRGVCISWTNLSSNVEAMRKWLEIGEEDSGSSWLPLYHDMGLIGFLLGPPSWETTVWIMRPDQFVREPMRWLESFGVHGATISACPNFGLGYVRKRVRPEQVEGLDLSGWRTVVVAAERISPRTLTDFADLLAPCGFSPRAFTPGYGLAEGTVAVATLPVREPPQAFELDWDTLRFGTPATFWRRAVLDGSEPEVELQPEWLVGCGAPVENASVKIVDDAGEPLPEGALGEIAVEGLSVAEGYLGGAAPGSSRFGDGVLYTGDAGLIADGQVLVLGRLGDSVKLRGRTLYMEDLEARLLTARTLPRGRFVVVGGPHPDGDHIMVVADLEPGEWADEVAGILRRVVGREVNVSVVAGPVMRTSSGKPRRQLMWNAVLEDRLEGDVLATRRADTPVLAGDDKDAGG